MLLDIDPGNRPRMMGGTQKLRVLPAMTKDRSSEGKGGEIGNINLRLRAEKAATTRCNCSVGIVWWLVLQMQASATIAVTKSKLSENCSCSQVTSTLMTYDFSGNPSRTISWATVQVSMPGVIGQTRVKWT